MPKRPVLIRLEVEDPNVHTFSLTPSKALKEVGVYTVEDMIDANVGDEDVIAVVRSLERGEREAYTLGGGASPIFRLSRVDSPIRPKVRP